MSDTMKIDCYEKFADAYKNRVETANAARNAITKLCDLDLPLLQDLAFAAVRQASNQFRELQAENAALKKEIAALKIKADRWDEVLLHVGAESDCRGRQEFLLRRLDDGKVNLLKGSVAEHFTNAIDKKLKEIKP